ncbi:uncharacterized protein LOC116290077 [Actinia tenebrosa]|uniref:Uncharacterized protein LOC116290077 n=1 Tax=Actinia tenebrosa TaxID=6105 RepID=A0A6P8HCX7_ACTTE|nr:uncharacterized protein LOC116290077 [Actinia tenebrosa]
MRVEYLITLAFLTAYSVFGISHGQYYYRYNYRPRSYLDFRRVASRPNPNRYFSSTSKYVLSPGWYRSRQDFWKARKKMYGYQDGMESTMISTTESPSMTTNPYPPQDGIAVVSSDQSFPSTMQSPVSQEPVQQPYIPGYPESSVIETQPTTQDLSSLSSAMSVPMTPANQGVTSTVATPAPVQSLAVQSIQQQTTASPQTMQFGVTKFSKPQSHLLPSSSSGSKLVTNAEFKEHNSSRICNPGPPLRPNPRLKNCLVIGDSIALGYLKHVKFLLSNICQVQHAPFARGSGAMDSRHGLKCLPLFLKTTAMEPTSYDAILFNFGMHDIDYSKRFPEEHVPFEEYKDNLLKLKESFLKTGAKVAFALTTPFPSDKKRNDRIEKFNAEAVRIMEGGHRIPVVDLYTLVVKKCGKPTYDSCSIMKGPRDVHYNEEGNQLLGVRVAATFATLLEQLPQKKRPSPRKEIVRRYFEKRGYRDFYTPDDAITCPDAVTRCPLGSTCCESLISLTGYGCCMFPNAVNCPDNWHCCPSGSTCSPTCTVRECKCITYTAYNNGTTISHESKANKAKYLAENNLLNSGTGGPLGKNFKPITDPLLRVLKKLASAHKTSPLHPKKNAQMWRKKLFESKGKLQFTNVKSRKSKARKTKHKTTVSRFKSKQHSINVELGHLIEHHHKHNYKDLNIFLKKGMKPKVRASTRLKSKNKHSRLKNKNSRYKSTPRKLAKPVVHQKAKLHHQKKNRQKMLNKKQHFHNSSHHKLQTHHNSSHSLHEGGKVSLNDAKNVPSKSHVDHEHQWNAGKANESLRNAVNHSAANQSLHKLANHSQSFRVKFVADKNKLKKDSINTSYVFKLETDETNQGKKNVSEKSHQRPFHEHHSFKDDHIFSGGADSGSAEGSGLRDISNDDLHEEYVSGSGIRDNDPSPINPYLDKDLKDSNLIPQHSRSTIQSSKKSAQNKPSENEYSTSATSGSETSLLNVLISDSQGENNAMRDDLNPSGDGHATRGSSEDRDMSSGSGESLDQTLGEKVEDDDDHGFDLMSSALIHNDGANNEVIKDEQNAETRQDVSGSNMNGRLAGTVKKTTIQVKVDKGKSSLITEESSDEDDKDDDITGKHGTTTEYNADHGMNKPPLEDKERVEVDFDDNNNLISLDSLLEDNSGYSNETQSEAPAEILSSSTPLESRNNSQKMLSIRPESEPGLMNELPLESQVSGYPDNTQALERSAIKSPKTGLVENPGEGSVTENSTLETTVMRQRPILMENSEENLSNLLIKNTSKTTKTKLVEGYKNESSVNNAIVPTPKSEQHPFQRNDDAVMHVNPSIKSHTGRKHNQLSKPRKDNATIKLKEGDVQRANLNKKNDSKKTTSKTFVHKLPKVMKDNNVKHRQKTIGKSQGHQKESNSSRGSSKKDKTSKNAAISSSHEKKGLKKYVDQKKSPPQTNKLERSSNDNRHSVIGERDDIGNENIDVDRTSVSGGGSGRGLLEAYLATP